MRTREEAALGSLFVLLPSPRLAVHHACGRLLPSSLLSRTNRCERDTSEHAAVLFRGFAGICNAMQLARFKAIRGVVLERL